MSSIFGSNLYRFHFIQKAKENTKNTAGNYMHLRTLKVIFRGFDDVFLICPIADRHNKLESFSFCSEFPENSKRGNYRVPFAEKILRPTFRNKIA